MYKLLLSLRYLRSRYIALASIVSVTLGVATMIVVNSVMAGFQTEMYKRLHGILSDVVVEAYSSDGLPDHDVVQAEIAGILGDDLVGMTTTVHVPAMLSMRVRGEWIQKQINLIGIDKDSYAEVGDFSQYLLNENNRRKLSFDLHDSGYDRRLGNVGWDYRRTRVAVEREQQKQLEQARKTRERMSADIQQHQLARHEGVEEAIELDANFEDATTEDVTTDIVEDASYNESIDGFDDDPLANEDLAADGDEIPDSLQFDSNEGGGLFGELEEDEPQAVFDPSKNQWSGIVLGIAVSNVRHRRPDGEVVDYFYCRPGDDIVATFSTAGSKPQAESANFTVVDFYESKMSEYDSSFAFVPLAKLQELRRMIDPDTGAGSISSIQIKLREGADLNAARDKLQARFPAGVFPYRIQTWMDMQGPLLSAVQMETTILNLLLFMIIAVAGFGILATFFMIVVEKTRDIGILKSLGASRGGVMSIFVSYGFSLGCVGAGVGMALGLLFVGNINTIAVWLEAISGREVFDPTIYYFQEIPTIVNPLTITWICAGAMFIAVIASVLPAIRAARMHPVEALRYE